MTPAPIRKAPDALRTIGELSAETGIATHVLRYWERNVPALQPLRRAGGRRYYRAEDAALVRQLYHLVSQQGYTLDGAARALKGVGRTDAGAVGDAGANAGSGANAAPGADTMAIAGHGSMAVPDSMAGDMARPGASPVPGGVAPAALVALRARLSRALDAG
ncbi:MAG: MerR family transcriptional regulator [Sphingopyxis sp.]